MVLDANIFLLSRTDNLEPSLSDALRKEIIARGGRIVYISSEPQNEEKPYYQSTIADYTNIYEDVTVDYFDLSEQFSDEALDSILERGTIYLSGGNTYMFLHDARKRNLRSRLRETST